MRTVRALIVTAACAALGVSCGSGTEPGPTIDHLEITLTPARASYPISDSVGAHVQAVSTEGTWMPNGSATWRSLTPAIASVSAQGGLIRALARGTATIEVEMEGVTAQVTVQVRGVFHRGYNLEVSQTWSVADTPHVVELPLGVGHVFTGNPQDTVLLTIEPGATVRFRPGAGLGFGGTGTGALVIPAGGDPVVMEPDPPSPPSPSWQGLKFHQSRSQLRNVTLRHCGQDYPFDNPGACIIATGGELLIDGLTIDHGRNGLNLGGTTLTPGTRNLTVTNTRGYVATIAPHLIGTFPRGGQFSGNDGNEIVVRNGRVLDSVTWNDLGLPLHFTGGVSFEGPANPVLTLPGGTRLQFEPRAGLSFATGGLIAGETGAAPVVLESSGEGWTGVAIEHAGGSALKNVVLADCGLSFTLPTPDAWMACLTFGPQGGGDSGLLVQDVVIRGAHTSGVRMSLGARFNPASRNLTITQSAWYPFGVYARNIPSIPSGDYRFNGIDAIDVIGDYGIGYDSVSWHNLGVPYRFRTGLGVDSTLVLDPGVTIEVGVGMRVTAGFGNLVAVGTAAEPIVFRSVTPGVPGSWMGIELGAATPGPGTRLEHVVIADAGGGPGGYAGAIRLWSDPGGLLRNSTIVRSSSCGFVMFNGSPWTDDYTDPSFGNTFTAVAGPLRCQPPS
jgi:hypothetical protein